MALTDGDNGNGFYMPVAPAYGGGFSNGMNGFGGDWAWIILLLLLGWGGGYGNGGCGGGYDFPWLLNGQNGINNNVNDGFRTAQLNDNIVSVRDGINNLSTQLCGCCGDMQMAVANGFANAETAANSRQMANMNQYFTGQMAQAQGFNNVGMQIAGASADNRLGIEGIKYTVATENCADRQALNEGVRDIIANQTAGIQTILDKMCQQEIDAKNDTIAQLRQEVLFARGQASQGAQSTDIINGVYNRLNECPVGTVPVYGEQPIFTCNNNGCGCGCGNL